MGIIWSDLSIIMETRLHLDTIQVIYFIQILLIFVMTFILYLWIISSPQTLCIWHFMHTVAYWHSRFRGWDRGPMAPVQAVPWHRVEDKAPKPFFACASSWWPHYCVWDYCVHNLYTYYFIYCVPSWLSFRPRIWDNVTILMLIHMVFIMSMLMVFHKSPANE